ncbi:hypothetical protein, partial [Lysobacter sp. A3-1-A15]|uniref:hypothetical protein n=1 Tax=Novilysobacter viscosus TaxID=3098602 RepID=UPI002ED9A43F
ISRRMILSKMVSLMGCALQVVLVAKLSAGMKSGSEKAPPASPFPAPGNGASALPDRIAARNR